jgi:sugar phosphate isomerase/epimerase
MFRTAVITDEISQDLSAAVRIAKQYGLDALEIRSVRNKNPFEMTRDDVSDIQQLTADAGLHVCAVASPLFKCDLHDEREYRAHIDGFARCADMAHTLGTDLIRGFTFWNEKCFGRALPEILERFTPVVRIAKAEGVSIVIESEPSVNTDNMERLAQFLDALNEPCVAALYDAGNEIADPAAPPPFPDGYERLGKWIRHVHLKDIRRAPSGAMFEPALIGEGSVDYQGLIDRLKSDGYDGHVSVETHYRIRKQQMEDDLLVRPQGDSFSEGGEEATKMYLDILRDRYHWQEKKC